MTICVLTSAAGSPGVSTTALGLTLSWPRPALLIDNDVQQTFLTGYLQGWATQHGMLRILDTADQNPSLRDAVYDQSVALPDDTPQMRRLLLPGLPGPVGTTASAMSNLWRRLGPALTDIAEAGIDIILDAGRHPVREPLPRELLRAADRVLLMCIPNLRSVAATMSTAAALLAATAADGGAGLVQLLVRRPAGVLASSRGRTAERFYADSMVSGTLQMAVAGNVAFDPAAAAYLSEGEPRPKKWQSGQYARGLQHLANDLAQTKTRRAALHA